MADLTDIVNQGLRDAGLPFRINDIYEGSEAAKVALEVVGQARDEILRLNDYSFSRRLTTLTLLKGPPPPGGYTPLVPWSNLYPNAPYLYEYAYPADCLDVKSIGAQPAQLPDLDPRPEEWLVADDLTPILVGNPPTSATGPAAKVILCNVNQALLVYRARVTDPSVWDSGFIKALVASLGDKFSVAFGANVDAAREQKTQAIVAEESGADVRG